MTRANGPCAARIRFAIGLAFIYGWTFSTGCENDEPLPPAGDGGDAAIDGGAAPDRGVSPPNDSAPRPDASPPLTGPCILKPSAPAKYKPGMVYWGRNNYIEYRAGDLPIIISSPHGGYLEPAEIANRTTGVLGRDSNSQEYTREVLHYIYKATGRRPHVIINRLYRRKLDANREIKEAAQGAKWSEQAWTDYHAFIDAAKAWVVARCGKGHYFDFHTNGHSQKWVELGHLLSSSNLTRSDAALAAATYKNKSSMRTLAGKTGVSFPEIVRGPTSIAGLLQARGVKTVPSPRYPDPAGGGFFSGGYNTARHGSRTGGTIDGTQVETHFSLINTGTGRDSYSRKLAESMRAFVERYYDVKLRDASWQPPVHGKCAQAKTLTLDASGKVSITDSTAGTANEFGSRVTCGKSYGHIGSQVYYRITLTAGASYRLTLKSTYAARMYVFGDTCDPATISRGCAASGVNGALTSTNTTGRYTVKATRSGQHTMAVDARTLPYFGNFTLTIEKT